MASSIKPLKVWGTGGPNPLKVHIILKELDLPYELVEIGFDQVKSPEYLKVNPNGRIPAIYDPNTDITLWESGAILEYLTERYDTQHRLSFAPGTADSYHARQWLYFQTSGQGPYYGQLVWFKRFHSETVPSAVERYSKEISRVASVLESVLKQQKSAGSDGPWLVGNRLSYADLAFVPWHNIISSMQPDLLDEKQFPLVSEWFGKMKDRKSVQDTLAESKH